MRAGSWLILSSGLMAGIGSAAALTLGSNLLLLSGLAVLLPPMALASMAMAGLFGVPVAATGRSSAATGPAAAPGSPKDAPREDPVTPPVVTFTACPVVSLADRRRATAAVAVEPSFRRELATAILATAPIPAPLLARLETTLLARASALAAHHAAAGRREAVIVSVAPATLAAASFRERLALLLDRPEGERPRLVVLVRGGLPELAAVARLPRAWSQHFGLHLTMPPADEAELARACLAAVELGCLEVEAALLRAGADGAARSLRLVRHLASANVPVVVSGVTDEALLTRLPALPSLLARGPLFGDPPGLAAA